MRHCTIVQMISIFSTLLYFYVTFAKDNFSLKGSNLIIMIIVSLYLCFWPSTKVNE